MGTDANVTAAVGLVKRCKFVNVNNVIKLLLSLAKAFSPITPT